MFKQNEGSIDRVVRVGIGIVLISASLFLFTGILKIIALAVGIIALVTGVVGFCLIYALLGISTNRPKK